MSKPDAIFEASGAPRSATPRPLNCSVVEAVEQLRGRQFRQVALVSHIRHLSALDPVDRDLLVVSTDWLTWQSWQARGGQAVHYEGFIAEWPEEAGPPEQIFLRHSDWMYDDGRDLTLFGGVSIGKVFTTHVGFTVRAYYRLAGALERLIATVRPMSVTFFDAYVEFGVLSAEARRSILIEALTRHGVELLDRFDPVSTVEPDLPEDAYSSTEPEALSPVSMPRRLFAFSMDFLSRLLKRFRRPRDGVFFHLNWSALRRILDEFGRLETVLVEPVLLASQQPKRAAFIAHCMRHGIALARLADSRLSAAEKSTIERMQNALFEKLAGASTGVTVALRAVVHELVERGEFYANAQMIKSYRALFRRHGVRRLVIGDVGNGLGRLLAELAWAEKIPCDEILNGVFVSPLSWDARNGDRHRRPIVSRMLTWGIQNENWLVRSGVSVNHQRTGYPAVEALPQLPVSTRRTRRALVLPLSTECSDVRALRANVFTYLAEVVDVLLRRGFEVRVKLHPGRPRPDYYRRVLSQFSLDADVVKDGTLIDHLEWADIVVGPVNSNAFLEATAAGRQYYAMVPQPSSIDLGLCGSALVCRTSGELATAIDGRVASDNARTIGFFCEANPQMPPSRRFWHAVSDSHRPDQAAST